MGPIKEVGRDIVRAQKKTPEMKILLVDDDRKLCRLRADYLEPMGYAVAAVHNGHDGLEILREGDYQAVILDVMMPERE
jgi:two-component system response regulator CpxR